VQWGHLYWHPPTTTVDGSVSTTTFKFADNADLIGQALNFEVQGTDVLATLGTRRPPMPV